MRSFTDSVVSPVAAAERASQDQAWLPGLPHVLATVIIAPVLGVSACLAGLLMATLASFIVYLPLTVLALNGGQALAPEAPAPELTRGVQAMLLVLWTATAWAAAGVASVVG